MNPKLDEVQEVELNHLSYFRCKLNAEVLIKLKRYIIDNDIKDEDLEDEAVVRAMLLASVNRVTITSEFLNTFKRAALHFGLDAWMEVKLYRLNLAILLVACVEYALYPERDDKEYKELYRLEEPKVIEAYNKLHDLPKENIPNEHELEGAKNFFYCKKFLEEDDYLNNIRSYFRYDSHIDPDETDYIKNLSISVVNAWRGLEK